MITVHIVPILNDNYCYILEADNGDVAVIDPGESEQVLNFLFSRNLTPTHILLTHHHGDHIGGKDEIQKKYHCDIYAPAAEAQKIGSIDVKLDETSNLKFGKEQVNIIETPGHTLGQINFHFPESKLLFSGDTLFVMGCGRVFEGTMEQMHTSLQKLAILPDETKVYCGHEYTLANAEFLMHVAPDNDAVSERYAHIKDTRSHNMPSVPSTIAEEKQTNLFLNAKTAEEFSDLRRKKDSF